MSEQPVIIIGAGIAGLSAAVSLAARGREVTVLESHSSPGGKMRQLLPGGAPVDSGPTVLTLRSVFDELLAEANLSLNDFESARPLDLLARHAWNDQSRLDLFSDPQRSAEAIGELAGPAEARGYLAFCAEAARAYETLEHTFMRAARPNPISLAWRARARGPAALLGIRPFSSLWDSLGRHFKDPRLQQLFGRYATYCGSSPWLAPATLIVIAHVEREGVWHLPGGMQGLARALHQAACKLGVNFRFDTAVKSINTRAGRVSGISTDGGEQLSCQDVICTADPAAIRAGLLGPEASTAFGAAPGSQRRSLSAITWSMLGTVDGFPLTNHNVFFSTDYRREFQQLFEQASVPDQPTVYVCAQDRYDAEAPKAGEPERLFCLINAPAIGDRHHFHPEEIAACTSRTLERLANSGLRLTAQPDQTIVTTPTDFSRRFPATGGSLYGAATHGWQAAFQRPGARSPLPGLYLAGGGVHPGAGVPMVALSGRQAARCLIQDRASTKRRHPAATAGGT